MKGSVDIGTISTASVVPFLSLWPRPCCRSCPDGSRCRSSLQLLVPGAANVTAAPCPGHVPLVLGANHRPAATSAAAHVPVVPGAVHRPAVPGAAHVLVVPGAVHALAVLGAILVPAVTCTIQDTGVLGGIPTTAVSSAVPASASQAVTRNVTSAISSDIPATVVPSTVPAFDSQVGFRTAAAPVLPAVTDPVLKEASTAAVNEGPEPPVPAGIGVRTGGRPPPLII